MVAAKISDFLLAGGVALPQLTTRWSGGQLEMPQVSPGHTPRLPNALDSWVGEEIQPCFVENTRRYCVYPRWSLSECQLM